GRDGRGPVDDAGPAVQAAQGRRELAGDAARGGGVAGAGRHQRRLPVLGRGGVVRDAPAGQRARRRGDVREHAAARARGGGRGSVVSAAPAGVAGGEGCDGGGGVGGGRGRGAAV